MNIVKLVAPLMLLIAWISVRGQTKVDLESIVPPAPTAAELGKYASYPVGTMTGTPEISIPLYDVKSGSLNLPIILSYHASGIQVSQRSTDVGLGWSVMAGGTISRTIYGSPDDSPYGYFNYTPPTYETLFGMTNYYAMQQYSTSPGYDLEPDLFVYNFGGKSGKFIYGKNQSFLTIPFTPIIIGKNANATSFKIVDDNGDIYTFDEHASSNTLSTSSTAAARDRITTWYLTSIMSADFTDTIAFTYETAYSEDQIVQQSYPIGKGMEIQNGTVTTKFVMGSQPGGGEEVITSITNYNEKLVERIDFKNGHVQFNRNTVRKDVVNAASGNNKSLDEILVYNSKNQLVKKITFNNDYFISTPFVDNWAHYRLKLTGLLESDQNMLLKKEYKFDYSDVILPRYGSYGMDYWGYFNGATNTSSLIPQTKVYASDINWASFANGESYSNGFLSTTESWTLGSANREPSSAHMKACILKRITYPTGGYTEFEFEPHKYLSDEYVKQTIPRGGTTYGISKFTKAENAYSIAFPSEPGYASANGPNTVANLTINFSASHLGNTEMGETQLVTLINATTGTPIKQWKHEGDLTIPRTVNEPILISKGINYTLKNEVYGTSDVYITSELSWTENTDEKQIKIGGGLRIQSIKKYSATDVLAMEETYVYGLSENGIGVKLFDESSFYRNYEDVVSAYYVSAGSSGICSDQGTFWVRNFLGISKYNSINYLGSPILYSSVAKYEGNLTSNTGKTVHNYTILNDPMSFPKEFINSGNYGSINNAWHQGELAYDTVFMKYQSSYFPVQRTEYEHSTYNQLQEKAIILKQHKQFVKLGECSTDPQGPAPSNPRYGQGFFTMYAYPIKTGARPITKEIGVVYDQQSSSSTVTTTKTIKYQNASNLYPTETSVTTIGAGISEIARHKYPQDMTDALSLAMVSKNILSPVLEETVAKSVDGSETLLSTRKIEYQQFGNLIKPSIIKFSLGSNPLESRIQFNSYSSSGNITEQQKTGNIREAYIWGYNNEYPVARIIGKSYTESVQESAINLSILNNPNTTDVNMRLELSKLYELSDCLVTTYTYKPAVGVTSETDANGRTTYFEYDDLGRLSVVKDSNGNILNKYTYNYVDQ